MRFLILIFCIFSYQAVNAAVDPAKNLNNILSQIDNRSSLQEAVDQATLYMNEIDRALNDEYVRWEEQSANGPADTIRLYVENLVWRRTILETGLKHAIQKLTDEYSIVSPTPRPPRSSSLNKFVNDTIKQALHAQHQLKNPKTEEEKIKAEWTRSEWDVDKIRENANLTPLSPLDIRLQPGGDWQFETGIGITSRCERFFRNRPPSL